jgi:hypothetical protein
MKNEAVFRGKRISLLPESPLRTTSFTIILAGLLLILVALLLEPPTDHATSQLRTLFLRFAGEGGLALVSIGAIALLLELPHLSKYFQTKVANTIREQGYLRTLKLPELESLQENALKALWELEELGGEDGLFNYSKTKVTSFVAQPYRENILGLVSIKCTADAYEVDETISYTCRAVKKSIQDVIKWTTEKDEIHSLDKFKIRLAVPTDLFNEPGFREAHPLLRKPVYEFDMEKKPEAAQGENILRRITNAIWPNSLQEENDDRPPAALEEYKEGNGYILSLKAYQHVDKLDVSLYLKYRAPIGRSLTWQMTHSSKNVTVILIFPKDFVLYAETFGVSPEHLRKDRELAKNSPQIFRYNSWLLPESGFVFHLIRRQSDSTSGPLGN